MPDCQIGESLATIDDVLNQGGFPPAPEGMTAFARKTLELGRYDVFAETAFFLYTGVSAAHLLKPTTGGYAAHVFNNQFKQLCDCRMALWRAEGTEKVICAQQNDPSSGAVLHLVLMEEDRRLFLAQGEPSSKQPIIEVLINLAARQGASKSDRNRDDLLFHGAMQLFEEARAANKANPTLFSESESLEAQAIQARRTWVQNLGLEIIAEEEAKVSQMSYARYAFHFVGEKISKISERIRPRNWTYDKAYLYLRDRWTIFKKWDELGIPIARAALPIRSFPAVTAVPVRA